VKQVPSLLKEVPLEVIKVPHIIAGLYG